MNSATEKLFYFIDREATSIQQKEDASYLESLLYALESWLDGAIRPEAEGEKEEVRKAIQLAVLKGMKEHIQPHHQMTPDALGLLMGYFVELFQQKKPFTLLDPAAGTGNLLLTVMNYLDGDVSGTAVEIDDLLVRLAASAAELTRQPVSFFRQDTLQPLLIDPVDAVIADLPVGYYPDEETAATYKLKANEGMSYAHHLFIEQALKHTMEGGYLFLLVPRTLFESPQSRQLHAFLQEEAFIQAVMELPDTLVKNANFAKSVLILQKKKEGLKKPGEVLLARVPNLSNKQAMASFFEQVKTWFQQNKG